MRGIYADIHSFFNTKLTEFLYTVQFFLKLFIVSILIGLNIYIKTAYFRRFCFLQPIIQQELLAILFMCKFKYLLYLQVVLELLLLL